MKKEKSVDFDLKKANFWDYNKISEIYGEGFSEPPYNEPWTFNIALKKIRLFSRYCDLWKIVYENRIVGFIIINPNYWFPGKFCFGEDIAIKKEYRGKGIAKEALLRIMEIYKKKGFKYFYGTSNNQSKAYKLWRSIGIKENKYDRTICKKLK
ncbi:GNAT family N-acetyltransferase [Candidatus Pacearchaeota archaeon]|jgi:GNAT superfamily N-acetyltransferase|nr:GNAT family N-acetyltransferase [Candidatus Pacearchaeota archaeon]